MQEPVHFNYMATDPCTRLVDFTVPPLRFCQRQLRKHLLPRLEGVVWMTGAVLKRLRFLKSKTSANTPRVFAACPAFYLINQRPSPRPITPCHLHDLILI